MSIDSDVIRGHVDTIILKTLTTGDKYGYEIIKEIEQKSKGTYELKQPTLYSCLKRLESQGLISAFWKNSDIGGKRHYYKLTKKGRATYEESMNAWFNSRSIIDNLMGSEPEESDEDVEVNKTFTLIEESNDNTAPEDVQEESSAPDVSLEIKEITDTAQMVLDESSNITQEFEPAEPRDFNIEDLDENDVALLGDYYKTDENQINIFEESEEQKIESFQNDEEDSLSYTSNEADVSKDEESDVLGNYAGTDLTKYRQSNKDNYFEKISYGIIDESNINIPVQDEPEENLEENDDEDFSNNAPTPDFSTFNFFSNYPRDNDEDEKLSFLNQDEPDDIDEDNTNIISTFDEDTSSGKLHFGFSDSDEDDDDEMEIHSRFDDLSTLEEDLEENIAEDFRPTISIYGDNDENDVVDYSQPAEQSYSYNENYIPPQSPDLKPFNIGNYTSPEYKEKLNQLSSYAKSSYETQPILTSGYNPASVESKSITALKEDLDQVGVRVRTYEKPEKENLRSKKYLLVNKIKFVTSWITFGIMVALLGITYIVANNVGYTDLSLVASALPTYVYFILAGVVALAVPITYTIMYLIDKTKRIKPNYNALISLVFALLFFIVCLNIIYTLNILNGFTKFQQMDYNHLLWLLPAIVSSLIVFQSLVYSLLFKTKKFNA